MKAFLTSSLGGSFKVNGRRIPQVLIEKNGLLARLKEMWPKNAKILLFCGSPNGYEKNDAVYGCLKEAFPMSGLEYVSFDKCDDRNPEIIENLIDMNVLVLAGGHVPTQNRFMKELRLQERLEGFEGLVVAWSAGSMNCAETVYVAPELDGEATAPDFVRWTQGLGITKVNIFPHFEVLKDNYLDGLRVIEDITFSDSIGHDIYAMNDASYIVIEDEQETMYGDAWLIKDKQMTQVCRDGEARKL